MKSIVIATQNNHKLEEIKLLFSENNIPFNLLNLHDIGCFDEIAETSETIQGNASLKAMYISQKYNMNCFADDTGLEVKALNGAPGVFSARFAGLQKSDVDNCNLLLKKLENETNRSAQFKTVISLIWEQKEYLFEGIIKGQITTKITGINGFGYDPLFVPDGHNITFAQMDMATKNKISHRALATQKLINFLKKCYDK